MITLAADTAGQEVFMTLSEGRAILNEDFTDYLLILTREEASDTGMDLAQVPVVVSDYERGTTLTVTTVSLVTPGRYRYVVYGQNSAVNLDPLNASVVGVVERGLCIMTDGTEYFIEPTITIPDDFIAGQDE